MRVPQQVVILRIVFIVRVCVYSAINTLAVDITLFPTNDTVLLAKFFGKAAQEATRSLYGAFEQTHEGR